MGVTEACGFQAGELLIGLHGIAPNLDWWGRSIVVIEGVVYLHETVCLFGDDPHLKV